jgi:hypothetical protein
MMSVPLFNSPCVGVVPEMPWRRAALSGNRVHPTIALAACDKKTGRRGVPNDGGRACDRLWPRGHDEQAQDGNDC